MGESDDRRRLTCRPIMRRNGSRGQRAPMFHRSQTTAARITQREDGSHRIFLS